MNKIKIFSLILILSITKNSICDEQIKQTEKTADLGMQTQEPKSYKSSFVQELRKMHEDFEREVDQMFSDFFDHDSDMKSKKQSNKIEVNVEKDKDENKFVSISVHLPDNVNVGDIKIKAKGNNLEGSLDYNDHLLKFYVVRGRQFSTSVEYKQHYTNQGKQDSSDEDEIKSERFVASFSSESRSIPAVTNLEMAQASVVNNKLVIKLPISHPRQDWTSIQVKNNQATKKAEKALKALEVDVKESKEQVK